MNERIAMSVLMGTLCLAALGCSNEDGKLSEPGAAAPQPAGSQVSLEPAECGTVRNLHVFGGIHLAGQPGEEDWALLKERGVKAVISLRTEITPIGYDEYKAVTDAGMKFHRVGFRAPETLTDEVFERTRALLKQNTDGVLLHCGSGNRVGAIWVVKRVLDDGLSWEAALSEAKEVGLRNEAYEKKAHDYVTRRQKK